MLRIFLFFAGKVFPAKMHIFSCEKSNRRQAACKAFGFELLLLAGFQRGCLSHCHKKMALAFDYTNTANTSYHVSYHGPRFDALRLTESGLTTVLGKPLDGNLSRAALRHANSTADDGVT